MPMAFQLLLVISGVESPTQATEDSKKTMKWIEMSLSQDCHSYGNSPVTAIDL